MFFEEWRALFKNDIKGSCTATAVFAALRKQVVDCAARMNQQGPNNFLPSDESLDPHTRRFEVRRETWEGTVHARVRFELGGQSITVKQVGAAESSRIAFQVIPGWDREASTCRLEVYGDDGAFAAHEDPDLEVISELALEWLRRDEGD